MLIETSGTCARSSPVGITTSRPRSWSCSLSFSTVFPETTPSPWSFMTSSLQSNKGDREGPRVAGFGVAVPPEALLPGAALHGRGSGAGLLGCEGQAGVQAAPARQAVNQGSDED